MENRKSSTFETRSYILQHPSIRDCLSLGLINHSALARKICNERAIDKFDAVLAATKRFAAKANDRSSGEKISRLIEDAQVRVTNKIAVVVVNQAKDFEKLLSLQRAIRQARGRCNLIDGDEVITLIVSEQHLGLIKATLKNSVKTIVQGLAQINLIFVYLI